MNHQVAIYYIYTPYFVQDRQDLILPGGTLRAYLISSRRVIHLGKILEFCMPEAGTACHYKSKEKMRQKQQTGEIRVE